MRLRKTRKRSCDSIKLVRDRVIALRNGIPRPLGLVSLLQRVDDDDETAEAERERGRRRVLPYCLFKSICAYVLE